MKKNLDITKPLCSEQILPVPWPFVCRGSTAAKFLRAEIKQTNFGIGLSYFLLR